MKKLFLVSVITLTMLMGFSSEASAQKYWEYEVDPRTGQETKCWRQYKGAPRCNDRQVVEKYEARAFEKSTRSASTKSFRPYTPPTVAETEERDYHHIDYDIIYGGGWRPRAVRISGSMGSERARVTTTARDGRIQVYRDGGRHSSYGRNRSYYPWY